MSCIEDIVIHLFWRSWQKNMKKTKRDIRSIKEAKIMGKWSENSTNQESKVVVMLMSKVKQVKVICLERKEVKELLKIGFSRDSILEKWLLMKKKH